MDRDKMWDEFIKTGSVESYIKYTMSNSKAVEAADDAGHGTDNQEHKLQ